MANDEIAVVSVSKRVKIEHLATIADACNRQMAEHLAPAWGVPYRPINVYSDPTQLPVLTTDVCTLQDEPGEPGVLGWHSAALTPFARIFANPVLDDGGGTVLGDFNDVQRPSLASVFSHEFAEMTVDPGCDQFAVDAHGKEWDLEVCDPYEANQYLVVAKMAWGEAQIALSDFALPAWFRPAAAGPFNWMSDTPGFAGKGPFQIAPGGYAVVNGSQVFARRADGLRIYPPAWYLAARPPGARRARRGKVERRLWTG